MKTIKPKLLSSSIVYAHCDTLVGPTVTDGLKSLDTGNINYAMKWVAPYDEEELKVIFEKSLKIRKLNPDVREVADLRFLENLVRLHRKSEGEPFEGIKPKEAKIDQKVLAADECIRENSIEPLRNFVSEEELKQLDIKFRKVIADLNFKVDDLEAGRKYVSEYIDFFKSAEGENQDEGIHST